MFKSCFLKYYVNEMMHEMMRKYCDIFTRQSTLGKYNYNNNKLS